ncbi:hypothetical protein D3C86_1294560 [compost metagenome]
MSPFTCRNYIFHQCIRFDVDSRIVLPLIRITDLVGKCSQLLACLYLCLRAHPGQLIDALTKNGAYILDHLCYFLFRAFREIFSGKQFT